MSGPPPIARQLIPGPRPRHRPRPRPECASTDERSPEASRYPAPSAGPPPRRPGATPVITTYVRARHRSARTIAPSPFRYIVLFLFFSFVSLGILSTREEHHCPCGTVLAVGCTDTLLRGLSGHPLRFPLPSTAAGRPPPPRNISLAGVQEHYAPAVSRWALGTGLWDNRAQPCTAPIVCAGGVASAPRRGLWEQRPPCPCPAALLPQPGAAGERLVVQWEQRPLASPRQAVRPNDVDVRETRRQRTVAGRPPAAERSTPPLFILKVSAAILHGRIFHLPARSVSTRVPQMHQHIYIHTCIHTLFRLREDLP